MEELCGKHGEEMQGLHRVVQLLKEKKIRQKRFGKEVHLVLRGNKYGRFND